MASSIRPHGLPSPAATANSPTPSSAGSVLGGAMLPNQRSHPLPPGSDKEIALISYVDDKVDYITRRFGTKHTDFKTKAKEAPGYTDFDQFIADVDPLIDLVWVTGTPALQLPYLLTFAGMVSTFLPAFPFTTNLFKLCKRLDAAFSSLLRGHRTRTGARQAVSTTEKVRIKSLIDETRVVAVNQASKSGRSTTLADLSDDDEEMQSDKAPQQPGEHMSQDQEGFHADEEDDDDDDDDDDATVALALSKIYQNTMELLGDSLAPGLPQVQDVEMSID